MKITIGVLISLLLCTLPASASSTGEWKGTFTATGEDPAPLLLILEENGTRITGTCGSSETNQYPIRNGMLQNGRLSIEFAVEDLGVAVLDLAQDGDELSGSMVFQIGGQSLTGTVSLKRGE